ncbi:MAG: tetratricopeptide repeat protein [Gammaproteobacteria bacterium]|nr:tetratricopeptide repeat protein [Gammaproteobacteria bacterium]
MNACRMIPYRTRFVLLLSLGLLSACALLPPSAQPEDSRLRTALEKYTSAKSTGTRDADSTAREHLARARLNYIDAALDATAQHRQAGEWFQALQLLDASLKQAPDSQQLSDARAQIESEIAARLRSNDCRLGAARARYLSDKAGLLEQRAPLESKDYLQDWKSKREREELDQLAVQLRDCAGAALDDNQLSVAEETLAAAARINGAEFVAAENQRLKQLRKPATKPATVQAPKRAADSPQQRIRKARIALQSAITRGDLRQAKTRIVELRQLEGDSPQLLELDKAVSDAIAAYIAETHERANALYRQQQIEQARDLWQKILELDPEDIQARANLERAERVLKKLEELQSDTLEIAPTTSPPMLRPAPQPLVQ